MIVLDPHMVIEPKKSKCEKDHINGLKGKSCCTGSHFTARPRTSCPRNIPQSDQNRGISSRL